MAKDKIWEALLYITLTKLGKYDIKYFFVVYKDLSLISNVSPINEQE